MKLHCFGESGNAYKAALTLTLADQTWDPVYVDFFISSKSGKLGGKSAAERREVLRWMFFDNHKLSGVAGVLRFMMNFMPEERRNADVINFQAGRLAAALKIVETQLTNQTWLAAGEMTIADIAAAGYLFYEEPFTFDRKEYTHIDRWLDAIAAQPGWKHPYDMMPGSPADRA